MKNYWKMLLFILIYGASCVYMMLRESDFLYLMLVWNVILSTVPFVMICLAEKKENIWMKRLLTLFWILFLPNAFYMVTDFIHITNHPMIWVVPVEPYSGLDGTRYSMDIYLWARLLIIGLGAFYALLAALESSGIFLDMIHRKKRVQRIPFIILIALLSGIGIYIGRFLRFNSWDVLNPIRLLRALLQSADAFSLSFILIYAGFILAMFFIHSMFQSGYTEKYNHKIGEKNQKDIS